MATDRYSDDYTIVVSGGSGTMTIDSDLEITGGLSSPNGSIIIPPEIIPSTGSLTITGSVSITADTSIGGDTTLDGTLDVIGPITASSFSLSSPSIKKYWIPAIFFNKSDSAIVRDRDSSEINYSIAPDTGSSLYYRTKRVAIEAGEIYLNLNDYFNKNDKITNIAIYGTADTVDIAIHYTLEKNQFNGSVITESYTVLDSDDPTILRTTDLRTLYTRTAVGSFSHVFYGSGTDISLPSMDSGGSYILRIFSDNYTYALGSPTCYFYGAYITFSTSSP